MCSSQHGFSLDIFFAGCSKRCYKCHNPELWNFIEPTVPLETVIDRVKMAERAKIVSIMGGEPLEQGGIEELIDTIKSLGKLVALFTGFEFNEVSESAKSRVDYLKVGAFQYDNRTPVGSFLASKNQVMYRKTEGIWVVDWKFQERGSDGVEKERQYYRFRL
jgi:organic radical activating enzyme